MQLLREFERNWQLNMSIEAGSVVLVACSGGIDSLALTDMLHRLQGSLKIQLAAAHFEHGIRGAASLADAEFVQEFCWERQIPCHMAHGDVPGEMTRTGESLETAARRLRYDFLYGIREQYLMQQPDRQVYIATAHHQDDQAETVLMHILRGTGLKGLGGIRPRQGCIIRPLLWTPKARLADYCHSQGLSPRHDSTNDEADCLRNKLRLELLPLLEREYNPSLSQGLCRLAQLSAQDEDYIGGQADRAYQAVVHQKEEGSLYFEGREFCRLPEALKGRIIQKMAEELSGCTLPYNQVHSVLQLAEKSHTGAQIGLSFGLLAKKSYNFIYIIKKTISISENNDTMDIVENYSASQPQAGKGIFCLNLPGRLELPDGTVLTARLGTRLYDGSIRIEPLLGQSEAAEDAAILQPESLPPDTVYGDADGLQEPLTVRHRQPGDRIRLGNGSRKLKDFLIDRKISREDRERLWLVASGENILWLAGVRRFAQALVQENTRRVFVLQLAEAKN